MADKMDAIVSDLKEAITNAGAKDTKPYDTAAVVQRIDEEQGIAWVKIPGGVDETPVKRTIACSAGDTVQVRVSGGKAFIQGNASAPPTDDRTALQARKAATTAQNTAEQAQETAEGVEGIATDAKSTANNAYTQAAQAKNIADTTSQYFWFSNGDLYFLSPDVEVDTSKTYYERTGEEGSYVYTAVTPAGTESPVSAGWYERFTETGAHITKTPQDDFIVDPENGGGNLLARSNGIAVRDGLTELAQFGADYMQIGGEGASHIIAGNSDMTIYLGPGNPCASFSSGTVKTKQLSYTGKTSVSFPVFPTVITEELTINPPIFSSGSLSVELKYKTTSSGSYTTASFTFTSFGSQQNSVVKCEVTNANKIVVTSLEEVTEYFNLSISYSGYFSVASPFMNIGDIDTAGGEATLMVGEYPRATAAGASAFGRYTQATGIYSHAEGDYTLASGRGSHAEGGVGLMSFVPDSGGRGKGSVASGVNSHAQNTGTVANSDAQTALGMYNIADTITTSTKTENAVIIGNGTSSTARSNALTVEWGGEVNLYLDDTATSGTDYEIIQALTDLGWDTDVIG